MPPDLAAELAEPGPVRSAAVRAIASTLKRDLYVCNDRGAVVARRALDAALRDAAAASRNRTMSPGGP